jgi:hypothetical protein
VAGMQPVIKKARSGDSAWSPWWCILRLGVALYDMCSKAVKGDDVHLMQTFIKITA